MPKSKKDSNKKALAAISLMLVLSLIGVIARFSGIIGPFEALLLGFSILGAAFLLSWAAEVAELDISGGLAFAILALIVVLPEYAVDMYFTWNAAARPEYIHYATANMTGGNRLLIGLGWSSIVILYYLKTRKKKVELPKSSRADVAFLAAATIYSFIIPLKGTLTLIDTFFLVGLFVWYLIRMSKVKHEEPVLVGPAKMIGSFPRKKRILLVASMFIFSAVVIFLTTEPFAESLISTGKGLGIDEFLLVQWLAPLASEAPEFIVASIFVLRALPRIGFATLLSSKVNQWTLLIGTLPLVFSIASGAPTSIILDSRQTHEILITSAQSLLAVAIIINLRVTFKGALTLLSLFLAQLIIPEIRLEVTLIYIAIAFYLLIRDRQHIIPMLKGLVK